MNKEEDRILVARARKGDEKAFRELLGKYKRSVFSICLRMARRKEDAEDLAQDVFVKVFSMLERYDPKYAFSSWLFKITSNLCIDFIRKRKVELISIDEPVKIESGEFARQFQSPGENPEKISMHSESAGFLIKAVEKLPPHYKIIILLRHQEGLSYDEIAATLDVPLGTVKARIHRAREMLRGILVDMGFER